ncbi:MAG: LysR family transcriptional regulator [bacterium]|nr:LysR family transcriptional regulator [bacterium]
MKDAQLKIFLALIEAQSFTATAKSLGLSQPRVSEAIAALEKQFGQALFQRGSHGVRLTLAGKTLANYATQILALKEAALADLSQLQASQTTELLLAASSLPGNYILPSLLAAFCRANGHIRPRLILSNTRLVCNQVLEGQAEIGLVGAKLGVGGLRWKAWKKDRLVLILAPNHRWRDRSSIALEELAQEPLLLREDSSGTREVILGRFKALGLAPGHLNVVAELGGAEALKKAVAHQMGVAIVSLASSEEELKRGQLLAKEIDHMQPERDLFVITPTGKKLSPTAQLFLDYLNSLA